MVSRRKILSRSRDDLHMDTTFQPPEEEEDVWYQKEKLYKDHIQEVLDKWTQIDDEIWAKVIVLERNRRVAKAYARAPVLTVNGSDDGFDGFRIGLNGFDNPMRDQKTTECKRHIGHGVKIKMDDAGNILIKRVSKCNIFIKNTGLNGESAIGNDVLKLPACALEPEKPFKLFDMKKFQSNINRELKVAYPDRRRLESQCLSAIAFAKNEQELLECPLWVLIINVVAIDMLKSKVPPVQRVVDIRNRPRIPVPDEDPYSIAGNGSGTSRNMVFGGNIPADRYVTNQNMRSDKPPKLPPREFSHDIPKPDYDNNSKPVNKILKPFLSSRRKEKAKKDTKDDDPYYCGLRARVPNFVAKSKSKESNSKSKDSVSSKRFSITHQVPPQLPVMPRHHHMVPFHHQHPMWHTRSFESGIDTDSMESPYNQIYGRLPIPTRGYIPAQHTSYVSEIGLNGFDNPMRDQKTEEYKRIIGHGVKIKMDDAGNVLIKRISKTNVYIKNTGEDGETAIGSEILKSPSCALEPEKPCKLFDMKKFQSNVNRELRRAYPDRRRLESQCLSAIAFVRNEQELLECPIWVLIINVVAMDMLKSKLPPVQKLVDIKNRPRIPIPDEDPYSVAGNGSGSSGSSGFATGSVAATREQLLMQSQQNAQRRSEKPPKLPPRENLYPHAIPKPDYDEEDNKPTKPFPYSRNKDKKDKKDKKDNKQYDDPYYCGMSARVPNFVSKSKGKEPPKPKDSIPSKRYSITQQQPPLLPPMSQHNIIQHHIQQHPMWHARSYESGIDTDGMESPYNQIYGRLPIPTRGYIPPQPRTMFIGEWD